MYSKLEELLKAVIAEAESLTDDGHGDLGITRSRVLQAIQRVERMKARLPATEETTVTTSDAIVGSGSGTTDAPEDLVIKEPEDDVVVTGEAESPFTTEDPASPE